MSKVLALSAFFNGFQRMPDEVCVKSMCQKFWLFLLFLMDSKECQMKYVMTRFLVRSSLVIRVINSLCEIISKNLLKKLCY